MIKVYSAETPWEAQLIRGLLERDGIEAVVQGELLWTARGELPFTPETAPSLWVRKEDYERARKIIEDNQKRHSDNLSPETCGGCGYDLRASPGPVCPECGWTFSKTEPWICPTCGETNEQQFAECWKCAGDGEEVL